MERTVNMDNYDFYFENSNSRYYLCDTALGLSYLSYITNLFEFFLIITLFIKFVDFQAQLTTIKNYFNKSNNTTDDETSNHSENTTSEEQSEEQPEEQSEEQSEEQFEEQPEEQFEEQSEENQFKNRFINGNHTPMEPYYRVNRYERNFRGLRGRYMGMRNRFGSTMPYTPFRFRNTGLQTNNFDSTMPSTPFRFRNTGLQTNDLQTNDLQTNYFKFSPNPYEKYTGTTMETPTETAPRVTFNNIVKDINMECACEDCPN